MRRTRSIKKSDQVKEIPTQKQIATMKRLGVLLAGDLSYIAGDRESGPNGEKAEFLRCGKEFMRGLGHDLGFLDARISVNPGGIAVSGEVDLYGMWRESNGVRFELSQMCSGHCAMFRAIKDIRDSNCLHSVNRFLDAPFFATGDYDRLLSILWNFRNPSAGLLDVAA